MLIYRYKFCDGTVSAVNVSAADFALLNELDKRERENNRRHQRASFRLPAERKEKELKKYD